jgi:outer membrane immunogenic protein
LPFFNRSVEAKKSGAWRYPTVTDSENTMRHLVIAPLAAAGLSVGLIAAAKAADLPRPAPAPVYTKAPSAVPYSWTGFYVGADVGGAWKTQNVTTPSSPATQGNQSATNGSLNATSVLGGVYAGYNFQFAPTWVAGVEADFNWTGLKKSGTSPDLFADGSVVPSPLAGNSFSSDQKWLATARARIGYLVTPNVLAYATGGAAWTRTNYVGIDAIGGGCPDCFVASPSTTQTGYAAGGGLEWAVDRNWLIRGEYLFYHFPSATATATQGAFQTGAFSWSAPSIHTVRAGLAYKF